MGCFLGDLKDFGINTNQWTTAAPSTKGNETTRRNKGWNVSWRNGSLQRKSELEYGMQFFVLFVLFVSHVWPMGPNVLLIGYQSHLLQRCHPVCGH